MTSKEELLSKSQELWDLFVVEVQVLGMDLYEWVMGLTNEERIIGLCVVMITILYMILTQQMKRNVETGLQPKTGGPFVFILFLVFFASFGTGWSLDSAAGSFWYLF